MSKIGMTERNTKGTTKLLTDYERNMVMQAGDVPPPPVISANHNYLPSPPKKQKEQLMVHSVADDSLAPAVSTAGTVKTVTERERNLMIQAGKSPPRHRSAAQGYLP